MSMIHHFDTDLYAKRLRKAGFADEQVETLIDLAQESQPMDIVTNADLARHLAELKADLYKHLCAMAAGIVTVTVALLKLIP